MKTAIAIVGLDRVGRSLGLALKKSNDPVEITGFDLEPSWVEEARKSGAIDKADGNLHSAIENADVVVINLPAGVTVDWLEECTRSLKEGALLVNTAPVHRAVCEWAKSGFPEKRGLVNASPAISGNSMETSDSSAELFKGGVVVVSSPPGTDESSILQVEEFAALMGASVMFADPLEADGLLTQVDLLPRTLQLIYLRGALSRAGWKEAQKLTGPAFWKVYQSTGDFPTGKMAAGELLAHKDNLIQQLDLLKTAIEDFQDELREGDAEKIEKNHDTFLETLQKWSHRRTSGDWSSDQMRDVKEKVSLWKKLFGMNLPKKKA